MKTDKQTGFGGNMCLAQDRNNAATLTGLATSFYRAISAVKCFIIHIVKRVLSMKGATLPSPRSGLLLLSIIFAVSGCGGASETGSATTPPKPPVVVNSPAVADAGPDRSLAKGQLVTLDGSASTDADGDELSFQWTLSNKPANSIAFLSTPDNATSTFFADNAGTYLFTLAVADPTHPSSIDTLAITVVNNPPLAQGGSDQVIDKGLTVTLDGSGSSDQNGDPLSFHWQLLDSPANSSVSLTPNNVVQQSFVADMAGIYQISLIVNDGEIDSAANVFTIEAINSPPQANAGSDQQVPTASEVLLDGSQSTDINHDSLTYQWTLSDKPINSLASLSRANSAKSRFFADLTGAYQLTLVVNDGTLSSQPTTMTVTANTDTINISPIAVAGDDQSVPKSSLVQLDGRQSSDSDGNPLTYRWQFNARPQGSIASLSDTTSPTPTFVADLRGDYLVSLVVNDGKLDSNIANVQITAFNQAPTAIAGPDQRVNTGVLVQLDGTRSSDPNHDPLFYRWNFVRRPTGSTVILVASNIANPSFTTDVAGEYIVRLRVNDGTLASNISELTVTATTINNNHSPVANAGEDQQVITGNIVTLDGSASHDPDDTTVNYQWQLFAKPDNSQTVLNNANRVEPSFTPDVNGIYSFTLQVSDGIDQSNIDTVTIIANNLPPIANAGPDFNASIGLLTPLDGSQSSDPEGSALTYQWTIASKPSNSVITLNNANTPLPSFTPDYDGEYQFSLVVNDGVNRSSTATVTVTVANLAPIANAGSNQHLSVHQLVTLDGSASSDANGDSISYRWQLTSVPTDSQAILSASNIVNPTFTVDKVGNYTASLIVNDGFTDSQPNEVTITAINTTPTAVAGSDQTLPAGFLVTLDGSASNDVDGDNLSYHWQFDTVPVGSQVSLSASDAVQPSFTADQIGTYIISLTVNDGFIDSQADLLTIITTNINPTANAGSDQTVTEGTVVTLDGSGSHDVDNQNLRYQWTSTGSPDGNPIALTNDTTVNPTFTATNQGVYVFELQVNDGFANSQIDEVLISVINALPVADAGDDIQININNTIVLDGSKSHDDSAISYDWTIATKPELSNALLLDSNTATPSFSADIAGQYRFELLVNDGFSDSIPDSVIVTAVKYLTNGSLQSTYITENGEGVLFNIQTINNATLDAVEYLAITTTGIPDYRVSVNQSHLDTLNSRPNIETDFIGGTVNISVGQRIQFGQNISYINPQCNLGYWPTGNVCPIGQNNTTYLPKRPQLATDNRCATTTNAIGIMVNGTAMFGWNEGDSFNNEGTWRHIANRFKAFDLDLCQGHVSDQNQYHHHGYSNCLQSLLADTGQGHSPLYGYAADGYPIYGPYHGAGELAQSAWRTRDYDNIDSASGCGVSGQRSCVLVDAYDLTKGTTAAATQGPYTTDTISSASGNPFTATSGYYFEDHYYDPSLTKLAGAYLDEHNGHDHDDYGYHYHLTAIDSNGDAEGGLIGVFPYTPGPSYYGKLPSQASASCQ